jgi:hypothetical protein
MVEIALEKEEVGFKLLPYIQCSEEPKIALLTNLNVFEKTIESINHTIANDANLKEAFVRMAKEKGLLQFLEPYNNKYFKMLKERGFLPSFLKPERKDIILEVFRCEAHREVMFELLKRTE